MKTLPPCDHDECPPTRCTRTASDEAVVCKELLDGIINLDTDRAKVLGFTSDKYDGYLWKQDGAIMVSFIVSKQRGNFRELVRRIHALGLTVKVPTPLGRMQEILLKNGYEHTTEPFDEEPDETVDVWVLRPSNNQSLATAGAGFPKPETGNSPPLPALPGSADE